MPDLCVLLSDREHSLEVNVVLLVVKSLTNFDDDNAVLVFRGLERHSRHHRLLLALLLLFIAVSNLDHEKTVDLAEVLEMLFLHHSADCARSSGHVLLRDNREHKILPLVVHDRAISKILLLAVKIDLDQRVFLVVIDCGVESFCKLRERILCRTLELVENLIPLLLVLEDVLRPEIRPCSLEISPKSFVNLFLIFSVS